MALLKIDQLTISTSLTSIVSHFNLTMEKGDIVALVGESGSGKTITSQAIIGITDPELSIQGSIFFNGSDICGMGYEKMQALRGKDIAYIFQENLLTLNPLETIGRQMEEIYRIHTSLPKVDILKRIRESLIEVGLKDTDQLVRKYPHELSGGMRQRVHIAIAMSLQPQLIIADEPTSSLDRNNKEKIIKLLKEMNNKYGTSVLFITHDIDGIRDFAQKVVVMKHGQIVEQNKMNDFLAQPSSDYGRQLLDPLPKNRTKMDATIFEEQETVLEVKGLAKYFSLKETFFKKKEHHVLSGLDLEVKENTMTALVGDSGSGKSTLVKCVLGIEKPQAGMIQYRDQLIYDSGHSFWAYDQKRLTRQLRHSIQLILQNPDSSFDPTLKIGRLFEIVLKNRNIKGEDHEDEINYWMDKCKLSLSDLDKYPHQLSGGKKQRLAIIRALLHRPDLLICDEITSALDSFTQKAILDLLLELKYQFNLSVLMISHDQSLVHALAEKIYYLNHGKAEVFS